MTETAEMARTAPERPLELNAPGNYRDWFRAGFFAALGVAASVVLLLVSRRLFEAALEIATPFVLGTAFAMLLDPLADKLEARGLRRFAAAGIVFLGFLLIVGGVIAIAVPILSGQVAALEENGPKILTSLQQYVNDFLHTHKKILGVKLPPNFNTLSAQVSASLTAQLKNSAGRITTFLIGSVTTVLEVVVTLIITFYLLLDIDRFRARAFYLAPTRWRGPMRLMTGDIGRVFTEYLRGLMIVSALYGLMTLLLLLALSMAHNEIAQYALLVAVAGGLLYSVPYLGPLVTALITFLITFAAGGVSFGIWGVLATLILNQVFDNVITPRVVGGGVGLHPVVSLFALTLGGSLFGLWGLLLSVPIAASIQAICFRLFPKLTTPTPPAFLAAQGVPPDEDASAKILKGEDAPPG